MPSLSARSFDLLVAENLLQADAGAEALAAEPERWHDALIGIQQSIQAQFAKHKAEALEYQTLCLRRGPAGKRDWFAFLADDRAWQSKAQFKLVTVLARLREAKRLRHAQAQTSDTAPWRRQQLLREGVFAHRARLALLVEDDAAWQPPRLPDTTRRQLSALLVELSARLEWLPSTEDEHGG